MTDQPLHPGMWVDLNGQKRWLVGFSQDGESAALDGPHGFGTVIAGVLKPWRDKRTVTVPEFWTHHYRSTGQVYGWARTEPFVNEDGFLIHHPARTVEIDA